MLGRDGIVTGTETANQVRMSQQSAQTGFAIETANELARMGEMVREHFDRNTGTRVEIVAEVDAAHPSFPDGAEKLVTGHFTEIISGPAGA